LKKPPAPRARGLVLGIETASVVGGIALVSADGALLGEVTLRNEESHSERILPAAHWLLSLLGFTPRELAAVAVSRGPGSFTGLRAGIAAAKGLAFALGVPLFGVPTLDVLAANAPPGEGPLCAVLNARRGEVFRALFRRGPGEPLRLGPDGLVSLRSLVDELPVGSLLLGEIPTDLLGMIPADRAALIGPPRLGQPRPATVAALGAGALAAGRASELTTLMPDYLRPCDAVCSGAGS
jgi:tRNA threonylcarbamoyladenosine biosynthesis protein TsaB